MSILSDGTILRHLEAPLLEGSDEHDDDFILIEPRPSNKAIQPASVDLRLGGEFRYSNGAVKPLNGMGDQVLYPGDFFLGTTVERVQIPANLVARVEGKSSLGRMGVLVHATAGFIDPGFKGQITLEFANLSQHSFRLTPGMFICQISFEELDRPAVRPYGHYELGSSYQGQTGTKESTYA